MANETLQPREKPIAVGEVVPDFVLQTTDKSDWKLSDAVKQGDVVLSFFPFAFTGVCGSEMQCITVAMARADRPRARKSTGKDRSDPSACWRRRGSVSCPWASTTSPRPDPARPSRVPREPLGAK